MTEKQTEKMAKPNKATDVLPTSKSSTKKVAMHDLLGKKLREYYDQIATEPVPDRFDQLLKDLDAKSKTNRT